MAFGMRQPVGALRGAGEPCDLTILVADDEPVVRATVGRVLKTRGCRVLQAVDGVHALEIAAQHPGPIHLLVTDIEMPRLDGHELHRRLNHQRPETRTIFMSGALETGLHPSAPFLSKPFAARALVLKVCEVLQILELGPDPSMRKAARD
jgi:two-component system, cell cycle sensor histidine kinase and response regulator CckA